MKNKDIYEGGSKLAMVLDASDIEKPGSDAENFRLYKLQYGVANAFLDIFITENGRALPFSVIKISRKALATPY